MQLKYEFSNDVNIRLKYGAEEDADLKRNVQSGVKLRSGIFIQQNYMILFFFARDFSQNDFYLTTNLEQCYSYRTCHILNTSVGI